MSVGTRNLFAFALAALAAAGPACGQGYSGGSERARVVRPDPDETVQSAASVVRVDSLRRQGGLTAKLFGTAGGDPAMNGLYTWLAFFDSPDEGWRVFRLGDFLSYRVLAEAPGRLTLEVRESIMDRSSGEIGARTRRLLVSWHSGAAAPASVSLAAPR